MHKANEKALFGFMLMVTFFKSISSAFHKLSEYRTYSPQVSNMGTTNCISHFFLRLIFEIVNNFENRPDEAFSKKSFCLRVLSILGVLSRCKKKNKKRFQRYFCFVLRELVFDVLPVEKTRTSNIICDTDPFRTNKHGRSVYTRHK